MHFINGLNHFSANFFKIVSLVVIILGPIELIYALAKWSGILGIEGAEILFAMLGALVTPVMLPAIIATVDSKRLGKELSLTEAIAVGRETWSRLFAAYIYLSFLFLFWLLVFLAPGVIFMQVTGMESAAVLIPFAVPPIWILSKYSFIDAVCTLDQAAGPRSRELCEAFAKGRRIEIMVVGLFLSAPFMVADMGQSWLIQHVFGTDLLGIVYLIGFSMTATVLAQVGMMTYYDMYLSAKSEQRE